MKLKRLLTLVMAVCMIISVFPAMMASAEELAVDDFDSDSYIDGQIIPYGDSSTKWYSYKNRPFESGTWQPLIDTDPEDSSNKVLRMELQPTTDGGGVRSLVTKNNATSGKIAVSFDLFVPKDEYIEGTETLYNSVSDKNYVLNFSAWDSNNAEMLSTCRFWINRAGGFNDYPKFSFGSETTYYPLKYGQWCNVKIVFDTDEQKVTFTFGDNTVEKTLKSTNALQFFRIYADTEISDRLVYMDNFCMKTFNDTDVAKEDADAIEIASVIGKETTLPTEGANGSTIAWTSNVDGVIENNAIVPGASTVNATLTATVTYGEAAETRTFDVKVLKAGTIFADGFETELGSAVGYNSWAKFNTSLTGTEFTIAKDENDLENPENKVLKINKLEEETANSNYIVRYIDRTSEDISVSFRMKSETQSQYHIELIDDNNGRVKAIDLGFNYLSNSISLTGYDNVNEKSSQTIHIGAGCLNINQWQDIKLNLDMSENKFWIYVDGECLTTTAIPFENSVPAIAAIRLRGMADSTVAGTGESILLVDDIEILTETAPEAGDIQVMYKNYSGFANRDAYIPVREGYIWNVTVADEYIGKTAIFAIYGSENDIETEHYRMLSARVVTLESTTAVDHKISPYGKTMKMFIIDELGNLNPVLDAPLTESIGYLGHEESEEE